MHVKKIFINLPVQDIERTRAFWTRLGFPINEMFSNEEAICVMFNEENIFAMFLKESFFKTFTNRSIATQETTQVINAFSVSDRESVGAVISTAIGNGGSKYGEIRDHGWMYQDSFADPDGHQWEVFHADLSQLPQT